MEENMKDCEFIEFAMKKLTQIQENVESCNEKARVELIFLRTFLPKLLEKLRNAKGRTVYFTRDEILQEQCDYDMRQCITNNLGNDIFIKYRYAYDEENSRPDMLVFRKR